jgi:hypothetical protein
VALSGAAVEAGVPTGGVGIVTGGLGLVGAGAGTGAGATVSTVSCSVAVLVLPAGSVTERALVRERMFAFEALPAGICEAGAHGRARVRARQIRRRRGRSPS